MQWITARGGRESGQMLVLFVLALGVLMGFAALSIDVGLILYERRSAQNAADAAALAGARDLPESPSAAVLAARQWAAQNGFSSADGATITVNTPYQGNSGAVEVVIEEETPFLFARAIGLDSVNVHARAVASRPTSTRLNAAFLVLNEQLCKSLTKTGSANLTINNGGGIMVNSACNPSISRSGSGSISAAAINFYKPGGYVEGGSGRLIPTPTAVDNRVPDPLASLAPPDLNALGISPDSGGTASNPATKTMSAGSATLRPGVYYGGIELKSTASVTFQPGTYVMAGGGLKLTGTGSVNGTGVMFYSTFDPQHNSQAGACAASRFSGGSSFVITGPTSGAYKDIVFWQDKACTNVFSMTGGNSGIAGIVYTPKAPISMSGGGDLGSIQVITNSVDISGNGDMIVNFVPYVTIPVSGGVKLVE